MTESKKRERHTHTHTLKCPWIMPMFKINFKQGQGEVFYYRQFSYDFSKLSSNN